jgi:CubicO group peptidase (beta-lactamase class C family)
MNRQQFRVLYQQFLLRVIDLELIAPEGDITKLLGQFAALLFIASLWILLPSVAMAAGPSRSDLGLLLGWAVAHFLVSTTMLVVGLFAVLSWESMLPDRRDVLVLSPLPVRAGTLLFAKSAAIATGLSLTVIALNLLPSLAVPSVFASAPVQPPPRFDTAMPPVPAAGLNAVLDRDLAPVRVPGGALAPGTHGGVAIGVIDHGDQRVFAFGTADADSIFEIGSITKTFTGLIMVRMAERGTLRLDEPVRELLPPGIAVRPPGPEITLLDLATHHSGLPRNPDNLNPADQRNPWVDYRAGDLYAYIHKRGVGRPENPRFLYSNIGFGVLGTALANRAGESYPDLVREEITGPLAMSDTAVLLPPDKAARMILGRDASDHPVRPWGFGAVAPAGGIRSTAADMLIWLEAQLHPEKHGAMQSALELSHRVRATADSGHSIALAWIYDADTGVYWHNGATGGYSSYAFFEPKADLAAVVLGTGSSLPGLLGPHIRQRLSGQPALSLTNPVSARKSAGWNQLRSLAAYWIALTGAGTFVFCFILSIQGLAQLLPRQLFLRVSAALQMTLLCGLLTAYFLQPGFSSLESLEENQQLLFWLPSYWFLGLFEQLNGPIPAQLATLAQRAWIGLLLTLCGAVLAYLICFFRTLRRIAEQPDILPVRAGVSWLPRFGKSLPTAVVQFSIRTLLRSRQHRVILSFYIGLAIALAIFLARSAGLHQDAYGLDPWRHVNAPMLVASIILMGASVLGVRIVFSMPLDLRANWIFRVTPIPGTASCMVASRRALYLLSVIPVFAVCAGVFLCMWPWKPAVEHLTVLALLGIALAELSLTNFRKIPFTCSYLPGRSYFHMAFLSVVGTIFWINKGAEAERETLNTSKGLATMLVLCGIAALCARVRTTAKANAPEESLRFEETPEPAIQALSLAGDGAAHYRTEQMARPEEAGELISAPQSQRSGRWSPE